MKILETFSEHFKDAIIIDNKEDISDKITSVEPKGKVKFNFLDNYYATIDFDKMSMKIIKETNRSKYGYKEISYYRYRTIEHMIKTIGNIFDNVSDRIRRKEEKSKKRKELKNPYEVGDILYSSWGYEQTNVDFYQIVRTSDKSVWVREIAGKPVSQDTMDSGKIKPLKDKFVSDEILRKPLQVFGSGKPYVSHRHGMLSKYDSGDKGVHYSWGY